jgi:nucleotide-binding universal stress UspA family protein
MRTIVVATDCSELSQRALRYADVLAKATGAAVVAVYGGAFSARLEGEGVAGALASRDDAESMMEPVRRCVEDVVATSLSAETERDIVIADARPADAIVETAHRRDAGMIVMATHDRNRLVRAVLGSVTDTVLHHTNCPVLILRERTEDQPIRRILCPFRDTPASAAAVGQARAIASAFDAEILFANAIEDHTIPPAIAEQIANCPKCEICQFTVTSDAGERIVRLAAEKQIDLIVLGTRHRRFSDPSVVGMPSSHVVRMAHCPVLAVTA